MLRQLTLCVGVVLLTLFATTCSWPERVIPGGCHDARTGEELKEVRDANGALFPVARVEFELGSLSIGYCGVSSDAHVSSEGSGNMVVYHPYTGEPIAVQEARRGIRQFAKSSHYAWY